MYVALGSLKALCLSSERFKVYCCHNSISGGPDLLLWVNLAERPIQFPHFLAKVESSQFTFRFMFSPPCFKEIFINIAFVIVVVLLLLIILIVFILIFRLLASLPSCSACFWVKKLPGCESLLTRWLSIWYEKNWLLSLSPLQAQWRNSTSSVLWVPAWENGHFLSKQGGVELFLICVICVWPENTPGFKKLEPVQKESEGGFRRPTGARTGGGCNCHKDDDEKDNDCNGKGAIFCLFRWGKTSWKQPRHWWWREKGRRRKLELRWRSDNFHF